MPKIVDFDGRRREIADKAMPVFAKEGFHDANLSKIAELCGFGRTTIYKYFKSKDDIFAYVLEGIFERLDAEAATILGGDSSDAVAKLSALMGSMVRDSRDDRNRMLILIDLILRLRREEISVASGVRERLATLEAYFERVLAAGMASGELRQCDPAALAAAIFSLVESFVLQYALSDTFSYAEAMKAADHLLRGLEARGA